MDNNNLNTNSFRNVTNLIFDSISIPQEKRDELYKTLSASVYLNFISTSAKDATNNDIVSYLKTQEPDSQEDFQNVYQKVSEMFKDNNFDINKALDSAIKLTLEDFTNNLKNEVDPKKLLEINEIINSNFK